MAKKIVLCSSAKFIKEILQVKARLERDGYEALTFPTEVTINGKKISVTEYYNRRKSSWNREIEDSKEKLMRDHINKIMRSDAIIVLNLDKDGKKNYVGGNVLIEMGIAFALKKKIFMINTPPEGLSYTEEIKAMKPIILKNIEKIDEYFK